MLEVNISAIIISPNNAFIFASLHYDGVVITSDFIFFSMRLNIQLCLIMNRISGYTLSTTGNCSRCIWSTSCSMKACSGKRQVNSRVFRCGRRIAAFNTTHLYSEGLDHHFRFFLSNAEDFLVCNFLTESIIDLIWALNMKETSEWELLRSDRSGLCNE